MKTDVKGQTFEIGKGVRQGDPLSPKLFNFILEEIFRKMGWEERGSGIKINGKFLNNLRFVNRENKRGIANIAKIHRRA